MKPPELRWGIEPKPAKSPKRTYNLPRPYCGDQVTVCIGAICESVGPQPKVILCTDTRLSISGFTSFDAGVKISWAAPNALALMADDPSHAKDLLRTCNEHFVLDNPMLLTSANWVDEFRKPVAKEKIKIINRYFQSRWGVTYDEYLNGRLNALPVTTLENIARDLDSLTLQCQLIIAPFINGTPRLLTVMDDASVVESDPFSIIGSGAWIANAALCHRQYSHGFDLPRALYYVYEAKKLSEAEGHVGKNTHILVFNGHHGSIVTVSGMKLLDYWFSKFSPQPLTSDVKIPDSGFWDRESLSEVFMPSLEQGATEDDSGSAESGRDEETRN